MSCKASEQYTGELRAQASVKLGLHDLRRGLQHGRVERTRPRRKGAATRAPGVAKRTRSTHAPRDESGESCIAGEGR